MPDTRNMQVRGPDASTHARKLPAPLSFRFVTSMTTPPRPPTDAAPPPCAPENAGQPEEPHAALELGGGVGLGDGAGAAVIVTFTEPDLLELALLIAVTMSVPALAGAV